MMKILGFYILIFGFVSCFGNRASNMEQEDGSAITAPISVHVNYTVINSNDEGVKDVIELWKTFLNSDSYFRSNMYWESVNQVCPSCFLRGVPFDLLKQGTLQNTIIGVIPLGNNEWELTSTISNYNDGKLFMHYIIKVYVSRTGSNYKLFSSTDYEKRRLNKSVSGSITFYYNNDHVFDAKMANRLDSFNFQLASFFDTKPIDFEYFISETSKESSAIVGFEMEPSSYVPNQYGAFADEINQIIYAGNGSEYYPHEVVHLYTKELFNYQYHQWIDEGLATMLGGSRGKSLEWHLSQLRDFILEYPDYDLNDISKLNTVPYGDFSTEFRYGIGGLIVKKVFEKEGIDGLRDILQRGNKDEDLYRILRDKFGVAKGGLEDFVKRALDIDVSK